MSITNKAILIIDMPENCGDCPLCVEDEYDLAHECCLKYKGYVEAKDKPEWCPLKTSPADVAPVIHARWHYTGAYPHRVYCPNCNREFLPNMEWIGIYDIPTNYCSCCGAKMDKSEDEE